ncbi:MAG: sel1 repeat family protein [Desulfuromonadales bacterium]|nr:sel1 repeat family protein [Desulfuromonadales bacterium]
MKFFLKSFVVFFIVSILFAVSANAGVDEDLSINARDILPSAQQGDNISQFGMGYLYYYGKGGVAQNYQEAFIWFKKAADQGIAAAQNYLGVMYSDGTGVAQNDYAAFMWYKTAADQGLADAQFHVGESYQFGTGVRQNYEEAFIWYKKAAEQGHAGAQFFLGGMYFKAKNYQEAFKWLRKAAEQGDPDAQNILKNEGINY